MMGAILLAAGRARRFGSDKLRAPLPNGTPLALAALRALHGNVDEVVAVVGPHTEVAPLLAAEGARLVVAADAEQGVGRSIAAGIGALATDPACDGALIALADMPFIRCDTLAQLVAMLRLGAAVVAPVYRGTRGNPVGFSRQWFPALMRLDGDRGARDLLATHRNVVQTLAVDDPGILVDIDHPCDLHHDRYFSHDPQRQKE